jgi:hypothetical protein
MVFGFGFPDDEPFDPSAPEECREWRVAVLEATDSLVHIVLTLGDTQMTCRAAYEINRKKEKKRKVDKTDRDAKAKASVSTQVTRSNKHFLAFSCFLSFPFALLLPFRAFSVFQICQAGFAARVLHRSGPPARLSLVHRPLLPQRLLPGRLH